MGSYGHPLLRNSALKNLLELFDDTTLDRTVTALHVALLWSWVGFCHVANPDKTGLSLLPTIKPGEHHKR